MGGIFRNREDGDSRAKNLEKVAGAIRIDAFGTALNSYRSGSMINFRSTLLIAVLAITWLARRDRHRTVRGCVPQRHTLPCKDLNDFRLTGIRIRLQQADAAHNHS